MKGTIEISRTENGVEEIHVRASEKVTFPVEIASFLVRALNVGDEVEFSNDRETGQAIIHTPEPQRGFKPRN